MFSNPLKQAAEKYLSTSDNMERERNRQQLVRAGASAVSPLIDALIVVLRNLKSASWGKREMSEYADAIAEFLGPYAEHMRREIEAMPDRQGNGMSMAQAMLSREACDKAWQVISQIGESGVRALFALINGRDARVRLAAILALSIEENPSRYILNSLATSAPFQRGFSSEIEVAAGLLALRIMASSGDRRATEMLDQYGREFGMRGSEFADALIDQGILLLAK